MTLRFKMIVGIGAILLAVVLVYATIAVRMQAAHLEMLAQREAELIVAVTERAIERAMTEGKTDQVRAILEEIGALPHLVALWIADAGGKIVGSSTPADQAAEAVGISRPIPNRPACHGCHGADRTLLGAIHARVAFPSVVSHVAGQWTVMVLPAILALVAAGALIAIYFTLVVGRRIGALSHAIRRVQAGDLTAKVPQDDHDELGRLGESFNVMVARLGDAQRQLEDRHAAEIRRAEHLAALGKVAAGIAHEINNPLAGMQNCVRTLLKGTIDERRRARYLEMLREGLARIDRIVSQLLNFARESPPRLARTDLAAVVTDALALVEHEVQARNIVCAVAFEPGLPALVADARQLEQVFLNIVMNALEAMPPGGTITITAGVRRRDGDRFVEARIADTGVGIPPENLPRVFDPFFTTKEVGNGTGLGLSVSYGIVKAHGGAIEVESEVGKGSTFVVVLPVADEGGRIAGPNPPRGR